MEVKEWQQRAIKTMEDLQRIANSQQEEIQILKQIIEIQKQQYETVTKAYQAMLDFIKVWK